MSKIYHYFVEGECEQKLLNAYRISPYELFTSGKVTVFNFINKKLDYSRIRVLDRSTIIILVYDIDVNITKTLEYNLSLLKKFGFNKIYHIQSINNFEDELVFSTNLQNINTLFKTQGKDDFKREFIHCSNIVKKLNNFGFDISKMWSRVNNNEPFNKYSTDEALKIIKSKR